MNDRIIELREALHLSQQEFSAKLGLTRSWLSNVELGIRQVQDRHITLILAAFPQVSERWIRTGEGDMFITQSSAVSEVVKKYSFSAIVEKLLETYEELSEADQETVLRYTQTFVSKILAGYAPDQAVEQMGKADEDDIDAEVERYRQQLLNEKMASSPSSDTGEAAPKIG